MSKPSGKAIASADAIKAPVQATPISLNVSTESITIQPSRGWAPLKLVELWEYREVLYFLIWRDVKVRYRQTIIGVGWAIIQPVLTMVVFGIVFGRLGKMPSDGLPYPLFAFIALVPWTFFARGLNLAADSLVASGNLITKVYFPRLLVPAARVLSGSPDLALSFAVLLGMLWWYGRYPPVTSLLLVPAFAALALLTALGAGLWLSALNVRYRDVQHVVPFMTQLWLFATPIAYPSSLVPGPWRLLYALNPMVGVVEGFRWALVEGLTLPSSVLAVSAGATVIVLVSGAFFFRRVERTFADVV